MIRYTLTCAFLTLFATAANAQLNVAASANGGVATQSSNINTILTAEKANDGDRRGNANAAYGIAHTNLEFAPFWQATFAAPSAIGTVNVFNRTDAVGERINPFNVFLYLGTDLVYSATDQTFVPTITAPNVSGMEFATGGVFADRVRIQLSGRNYLQLAEVEAISPVPEPASLAALGLGAVALLRRRKRA